MNSPLEIPESVDSKGGNYVFLISLPRSGSTLLQRILGANSEIHTIAEPWTLLHPLYGLRTAGIQGEFGSALARQGLADLLSGVPEGEELYFEGIRAMVRVLYGRLLELSGKRLFLDKTPRYYFIAEDLARVFPNARMVFILRNPLAVLSSVLDTWFENRVDLLLKGPNVCDLFRGPALLANAVKKLQARAVIVRYEDLVNDPASEVARMCGAMTLEFKEEMLEYGKKPVPKGRFGDQGSVNMQTRAVPTYLNSWTRNLCSSIERRSFAIEYIRQLGESVCRDLGYPMADLLRSLESPSNPEFQSSRGGGGGGRQEKTASNRSENPSSPHQNYKPPAEISDVRRNQETPDVVAEVQQSRVAGSDPNAQRVAELLRAADAECSNGNLSGACKSLELAADLNPENGEIAKSLGALLYRFEDFSKAEQYFSIAADRNPEDPSVWIQLALVNMRLDRADKFEPLLTKALDLDPENRDALKAWADGALLKNRFEQAANIYSRIIRLHPRDVESLLALGVCYFKSNEFEFARRTFEKVLEFEPQNQMAVDNLNLTIQQSRG